MAKVIILQGIPASGKTTFAKKYQKEHPGTKRVNRDDLRTMIDNSVWSKENEELIVRIEEFIVTLCLLEEVDIIIDDTNLAPKIIARWKTIVEDHNRIEQDHPTDLCRGELVEIEIKEFKTNLEECIRRDSQRKGRAHVGRGVIENFYNKYAKKNSN